MRGLRRIERDLRERRHVEAYVVAAAAVVLATLSLIGDLVGDELRWAVVFAALSLLTYQVALTPRSDDLDDLLHNRAAFDDVTFHSRLRRAQDVRIFAPSGVNLLSADTANHLRTEVLSRQEGLVRIVVLDPHEPEAVAITARQLDQSTEFAAVDLASGLATIVNRIEMMASWNVAGTFEYGFAPFNPGFSIVAINPYGKDGLLIVEIHGLRNEATASRMHLQLTRTSSERWFVYWRNQFEHLWQSARRPETTGEAAAS
jgi:hypothetical protein